VTDFEPDFPRARLVVPSPNHDARVGCERADILLLHYTGMESTDDALARLCEPAAKVSSHYLVRENGEVLQLVPESRRARHAGVSSWEGTTDINSRSVGIEIANPGHDFGYPEFTEPQIDALIDLCRDVVARLAIRKDRVLAHSDVAPSRKNDPGEKFPWARLHAAGVGHWVEPIPIVAGPSLAAGASGAAVEALQSALADYGYGIEVTGAYDAATTAVVTAFQRHFRPHLVDGIADRSTVQTLQALLASRDLSRPIQSEAF
jgi:N-acetylmuramoyl-L-alanine amidase